MLEACRDHPLPTTFRVNQAKPLHFLLTAALRRLAAHTPTLLHRRWLSKELWQQQKHQTDQQDHHREVWEVDYHQYVARSAFKQWCEALNREGWVVFQELSSMIPALLLSPAPSEVVLDLCAAPGTKTSLLMELQACSGDPVPPGVVVANDADLRRACLPLSRQVRKVDGPGVLITVVDGRRFPLTCGAHSPDRNEGDAQGVQTQPHSQMFDRVLADVPCSGDGTLRKNFMIWRDWRMQDALELHNTQVSLLLRGLYALREGGRLVYSTCSFNPLENEAVIAAALRHFNLMYRNARGDDQMSSPPPLVTVCPPPVDLLALCNNTETAPTAPFENGDCTDRTIPSLPGSRSLSPSMSGSVPYLAGLGSWRVPNLDSAAWQGGCMRRRRDRKTKGSKRDSVVVVPPGSDMPPPFFPAGVRWTDIPDTCKQAGLKYSMLPPLPNPACNKQCQEATCISCELRRCVRLVPHLTNVGGFFIAILDKHHIIRTSHAKGEVSPDGVCCSEQPSASLVASCSRSPSSFQLTDYLRMSVLNSSRRHRLVGSSYVSFTFAPVDDELIAREAWQQITAFYGVSRTLLEAGGGALLAMIDTHQTTKKICLVSDGAWKFLDSTIMNKTEGGGLPPALVHVNCIATDPIADTWGY